MIEIEYDNPGQERAAQARSSGLIDVDFSDHDDTKIALWHPFKDVHADSWERQLKAIGGRWKSTKAIHEWQVPKSVTNLKELEKLAGERFEPTERLEDWFFAEMDKINSIDNLSTASADAELSDAFKTEAPLIKASAFAYQRAGIAFGAKTKRYGMFDQPGLGKTMQTFGTMVEAGVEGDILVLAPTAAVAITWPNELAKWLPHDEYVVVNGPGAKRKQLLEDTLQFEPEGKRRWIIVNLEMARAKWIKPSSEIRYPKVGPNSKNGENPQKRQFPVPGWWDYSYPILFLDQIAELDLPPWSGIVVDESHRALICHNATLQAQTLIRAGMAQLPLAPGGIKVALSGTPMRGKPENLWGTLNWLYPELYPSYWEWAERWFNIWEVNDNERKIDGLDETKSAEFYKDIAPYVLRRTKKEVRAELPDKLYAGTPLPDESGMVDENSPVGHWLEMSPKQRTAYESILQDAQARLESGLLVANGRLAELIRLKQFASSYGDIDEYLDGQGDIAYKFAPKLPSNKFDWLLEFLDDLGINKHSSMEIEEDGEEEIRKVVIASQFTSLIDLFAEELTRKGIPNLVLTGKTRTKDRVAAAERWQQAGGPRVFLLNTMAGGVSLTLDAADDLVLLDETFIPDDQEQVEDRIHRASRMHQVTIHYLRSLGTVEETIAMTTNMRERMTKLLLDGERGVAFFKRLLTPLKR